MEFDWVLLCSIHTTGRNKIWSLKCVFGFTLNHPQLLAQVEPCWNVEIDRQVSCSIAVAKVDRLSPTFSTRQPLSKFFPRSNSLLCHLASHSWVPGLLTLDCSSSKANEVNVVRFNRFACGFFVTHPGKQFFYTKGNAPQSPKPKKTYAWMPHTLLPTSPPFLSILKI